MCDDFGCGRKNIIYSNGIAQLGVIWFFSGRNENIDLSRFCGREENFSFWLESQENPHTLNAIWEMFPARVKIGTKNKWKQFPTFNGKRHRQHKKARFWHPYAFEFNCVPLTRAIQHGSYSSFYRPEFPVKRDFHVEELWDATQQRYWKARPVTEFLPQGSSTPSSSTSSRSRTIKAMESCIRGR